MPGMDGRFRTFAVDHGLVANAPNHVQRLNSWDWQAYSHKPSPKLSAAALVHACRGTNEPVGSPPEVSDSS